MNYFGKRLRELREKKGLLLREVAAQMNIDTGLLSKIERGERRVHKDNVVRASKVLEANGNELIILWLADKINDVIENEPLASEAIKIINKNLQ